MNKSLKKAKSGIFLALNRRIDVIPAGRDYCNCVCMCTVCDFQYLGGEEV